MSSWIFHVEPLIAPSGFYSIAKKSTSKFGKVVEFATWHPTELPFKWMKYLQTERDSSSQKGQQALKELY